LEVGGRKVGGGRGEKCEVIGGRGRKVGGGRGRKMGCGEGRKRKGWGGERWVGRGTVGGGIAGKRRKCWD
jgi:hypothetical protein